MVGALSFGGSVVMGALIIVGAKSLKNGIDKVDK